MDISIDLIDDLVLEDIDDVQPDPDAPVFEMLYNKAEADSLKAKAALIKNQNERIIELEEALSALLDGRTE